MELPKIFRAGKFRQEPYFFEYIFRVWLKIDNYALFFLSSSDFSGVPFHKTIRISHLPFCTQHLNIQVLPVFFSLRLEKNQILQPCIFSGYETYLFLGHRPEKNLGLFNTNLLNGCKHTFFLKKRVIVATRW